MFALDIDWHVHSVSSVDSQMTTLEACAAAKQRGVNGVCFTEHVDLDPRDTGYQFFDWGVYQGRIDEARRAHPEIQVKTGFELNWQRKFAAGLLDFLDGKAVDLVLGSVHWLETGHICEPQTFRPLAFADFIEEWNKEALDLLHRNLCQGFAHFDYFYGQGHSFYPRLKREDVFDHVAPVVDAMIKHGVSLEINTSALRKGLTEPFPCWDFIDRYLKAGGRKVHLGSDSHAPGHIAHEFPATRQKLEALLARYA